MVTFYGQGMNAGLEDVRVLFEKLDGYGVSQALPGNQRAQRRARALAAYTAQRVPDAHAINNLAIQNYREISNDVSSTLYKARKWIEETVSIWMPWTGWRTQYTRMAFENQRYSDVVREVKRQRSMLGAAMAIVVTGVVGLGFAGLRRVGTL